MSTNSEINECIHFLIGHSHSNFQHRHWVHDFPASKAHTRPDKTVKQKNWIDSTRFHSCGTLDRVVIVGILSAVALPQFFSQTKRLQHEGRKQHHPLPNRQLLIT